MSLAVRSFNPIWLLDDLEGNLFDDTFYMFVLENTIPYIPSTVWHDPNMNTPWTNPIQFLANGTLPVDIYWDPDAVYRLEFRQGPTQADPLIYEVNNYMPGSGGVEPPVDIVGFFSSNQITNPQFALISFDDPVTIAATNPDPIEIGPGWFLEAQGTGAVTLSRESLNNATPSPTNAPYLLRLTLTGWSEGTVFLRQRFQQNGMLWANKIVSSSITARLQGSPQNISATLVDSNDSLLGTVLASTAINQTLNEYTGHSATLPASTNPDTPPAAYIDYKLALPSNIDIYVSSFQLVVQDIEAEPKFDQDSIDRQIDHTYHTAYPIVPVGTIIDFGGFGTPEHYLFCDGSDLGTDSRRIYNLLFQALTTTETVTLTSASADFTVADSSIYAPGMPLEGTGIQTSSMIASISGNTITMNNVASASGPSLVRFFATGQGNQSTTFNVPDLRDYVTAGAGGTLFSAANNAVSRVGGSSTVTLLAANMPPQVGVSGATDGGPFSAQGGATFNIFGTLSGGSSFSQGSATPVSIIQKTYLTRKCIRFE